MSATQVINRTPARRRLISAGRGASAHIVCFITGALMSRGAALGSLSPFGASFAAAVPFRYLPSGLLGAALSYLVLSPVNSFRYIAVILAIGAIRWVLNEIKRVSRSRLFAPAAAFAPVLATGIALTFSARSELTEVYECVIEAILAAAGAYFISRSAELAMSRRRLGGLRQDELACLVMTGCILLLSFSFVKLGGASAGRALAMLTVMLFARYGFVKGGSVAGISAGTVFALSDSDLICLSAGYSLSGLVGGLLAPMGKAAVAISALLCTVMMAFASPDKSLVAAAAAEGAAASLIFLLIPKSAAGYISSVFGDDDKELKNEAIRRNVTMRLEHCSKALSNVTSCVTAVSEKLSKLNEPELERVCGGACERVCKNCGLRTYCLDKQKEATLGDLYELCSVLKERGSIDGRDVDEQFKKRCCKSAELAEGLIRSYKEYLSLRDARRRVAGVRAVVAGQFAGLSRILEDLSLEFSRIEAYDTDSSEKLISALGSLGLTVIDCSCRRSKGRGMTVELLLSAGRKTVISAEQLRREASRVCSRRFDEPSISFEGDRARVTMCELPLYALEIGSAQHICDGGALCGDCSDYFSNGEGSTVALLSDGMGTGGRAAVDANMTVSMMSKLCKAGLSYDCSLEVVNASLMIKSEDETLATLDMADFNRFTGRMRFMKAGACATYIRRGGRISKKDMPSLPLGILNEARFSSAELTLKEDDVIVMISDGALIDPYDWLDKLILSRRDVAVDELASDIVDEARKRRQGARDDDITAIAMRVVTTV